MHLRIFCEPKFGVSRQQRALEVVNPEAWFFRFCDARFAF
jgi:hypothetical protein